MGPDQIMLTLMGRYEPPLGAVGRGLDRLVLHRIAEACIRSFLRRTAANLEHTTAVWPDHISRGRRLRQCSGIQRPDTCS
jgi:hypothetical protein